MLRQMVRWAAIILAGALATACATPAFQVSQLDQAEAALKSNDKAEATRVLMMYLADQDPYGVRARAILAANPGFRSELPDLIGKQLEDETSYPSLIRRNRTIRDIGQAGVFTPAELAMLTAKASAVAAAGNLSDRFRLDLTDDRSPFPSLDTADARKRIFDRSLASLKAETSWGRTQMTEAVFAEAGRRGRGSYEWAALHASLPELRLSAALWRDHAAKLFPEEAIRELANQEVKIHLAVIPPDRLLLEDLLKKIRGTSSNISVTDEAQAGVKVRVGKLQWEEQRRPPTTQTVMYAQHQVNLLGAVLLMPRNASYVYEVAQGGVDVSYAFEVKAEGRGFPPVDQLIRERVSHSWTACSNARIQNVFGGVQPATFVANDHQVSTCSGNSGEVSSDKLRDSALEKIVAVIGKIPPIQRAVAIR